MSERKPYIPAIPEGPPPHYTPEQIKEMAIADFGGEDLTPPSSPKKEREKEERRAEQAQTENGAELGFALSRLPEAFMVEIWDVQDPLCINSGSSEQKQREFLEFIKDLDERFLALFQHFLDDKTWSMRKYAKQLQSFQSEGALSLKTEKEIIPAARFLSMEANEAQTLKELGMELILIPGVKPADQLLKKVIDNDGIDIETKDGQDEFGEQWQKQCPNTPMPCVPKQNYWWYLTQLKKQRIIRDLTGDRHQIAAPQFSQSQFLWVDSWKEENYDSAKAKKAHQSKLAQEFFERKNQSTVNIGRDEIDEALWKGDPAGKEKSERHIRFLRERGLNPDEYELRLIRQDEYARGAKVQHWGEKNLWTHFEHFFLEDDGVRYGLIGGHRDYGGPSRVAAHWRDYANDDLAVRLVLERNKKD